MSKIHFESRKQEVDGEEIDCEICQDGSKIYHNTSLQNLESILDKKMLEPKCDRHYCSGAVSFSLDKKVVMGAGNIKLQFDGKKVKPKLFPMCYVKGRDNYSTEKYWKAQEDYRDIYHNEYRERRTEEMAELGYEDVQDAYVDAILGLTSGVYKDECEWLTRQPINLDGLEKISYYLGWKIKPFGQHETKSCESILGSKYVMLGNEWYKERQSDEKPIRPDMKYLMEKIKKVKKLADKHNVPFEVNSCFTLLLDFSESSMSPKYMKLDKENLKKLSKGIMPEYLKYDDAQQLLKNLRCRC